MRSTTSLLPTSQNLQFRPLLATSPPRSRLVTELAVERDFGRGANKKRYMEWLLEERTNSLFESLAGAVGGGQKKGSSFSYGDASPNTKESAGSDS